MSVSQKSLVGRQNGFVPIAGSGSIRDKMGLSKLVLVGDWIAFALNWDVFYLTVLGMIPRCLRRSTFRLLSRFKHGERIVLWIMLVLI